MVVFFIVSAKIRLFPLNHQMFSQKLWLINDICNGMTCRGGPCARPHPEWRKRRSAMSIHPCCISVSIRVADGHRARPCTSFVVVGCLFHHFHGFSAFLYDHHLAGLSLADALALEVEYLFLLVVVVYGQVGDAGGIVCAIKSCADF